MLDLTLARAGPTCVRHLSDWGADVIIIQAPGASDVTRASRDGFDYQNLHRGKRAISLDLKTPSGHEAFLRLARTADVVVENMRPAVKHRLGIAYEDLKVVNPRLVYGSISGFGQDGPYGNRAGVDQIAQGMGGLMSITGAPGRRADWLENPDWRSSRGRVAHRESLNAAIAEETRLCPSAHWIGLLAAAGIPCGPIYAIDQAFADPQVQHLGVAAPVDHPRFGPTRMVASPLNIGGADKKIRGAAPVGPDHTDEVLAGVGYSADEIARMRRDGVI